MSFSQRWSEFFDQDIPNIILRVIVMFTGIACVAFGIAMSRATDLGVSAISCIPGVLSYATPLTIGTWTFGFNLLLLLSQIVLLRREFNPLQLVSILFVFIFSAMIDFFVPITASIPMPYYPIRILFCLVSCCFIAMGVWLQTCAALVMLPGDGAVQTISYVFKLDFGKTKVGFDVSMITSGAIISLLTMGGLYGVREGSVIAACLTGVIIRLYAKLFPNVDRFCPTEGHISLIAK